MDLRCHHHPDREADGTCCYCERPLCTECLAKNPQGKVFCRREEECLAYQDALTLPGESSTPIVDHLTDTLSLEAQANRLSSILEELGELKGLLEDTEKPGSSPGTGEDGETHPLEADVKIPGFCARKLAEEAQALLELLAFRLELMQKERELSGDSELPEKGNEVRGFLEQEAKPKVREYRDWTKPYSDLDAAGLLSPL